MANKNVLPVKVSIAADSSFPVSVRLASVGSIDGKTEAATNLYTVPTGKTAIITSIIARLSAASNVTQVADIGVGVASGEDDIIASATLTSIDTAGLYTGLSPAGAANQFAKSAVAADVIKVGVDTAATTTAPEDVYTLVIDLFGYLI